jgi:acetylornithine/N-succinyldiaminopimelate aminotransferase
MEIVNDTDFLDEVRRKSALLRQKLEGLLAAHPDVFIAVRGEGLMVGIECKVPVMDMVNAGYAQDMLTVPAAEDVVRLLPPLNITDADIDEAIARLDRAASSLAT